MKTFLIAGLTNVEINLKIERFPLEYFPVCYPFNGIDIHASGVGLNLGLALKSLGSEVSYASMTGSDYAGDMMMAEYADLGLEAAGVLPLLEKTPVSVILRDESGRRQIHVDLKHVQETEYPRERFLSALPGSDVCVLTPINFARPFLAEAKKAGKIIATDLHVLSNSRDEYNRDFLSAADLLFLSNEAIDGREEEFILELSDLYQFHLAVVGMGSRGALLWQRSSRSFVRIPAVLPRPMVNSVGAGDALFASFLHFWAQGVGAAAALEKAVFFAGWKIGANGAARGFLSAEELEQKCPSS